MAEDLKNFANQSEDGSQLFIHDEDSYKRYWEVPSDPIPPQPSALNRLNSVASTDYGAFSATEDEKPEHEAEHEPPRTPYNNNNVSTITTPQTTPQTGRTANPTPLVVPNSKPSRAAHRKTMVDDDEDDDDGVSSQSESESETAGRRTRPKRRREEEDEEDLDLSGDKHQKLAQMAERLRVLMEPGSNHSYRINKHMSASDRKKVLSCLS